MNALTKRLIEKSKEPVEKKVEEKEEVSLVGKKLNVKNAVVKSLKDKGFQVNRWRYQSALGVLLEDPKLGKVYFKTSAKFVWDLEKGDVVSGVVDCSGVGDGILWARRPKGFIIVEKVKRVKDDGFNVPPQTHYQDLGV